MLTEEKRRQILPVWAGLVSLPAIYFLTSNFWKAAIISAFVGGSAMLGYGARWVLVGSFAIAVLAIAVALGLPPPDQWLKRFGGFGRFANPNYSWEQALGDAGAAHQPG